MLLSLYFQAFLEVSPDAWPEVVEVIVQELDFTFEHRLALGVISAHLTDPASEDFVSIHPVGELFSHGLDQV